MPTAMKKKMKSKKVMPARRPVRRSAGKGGSSKSVGGRKKAKSVKKKVKSLKKKVLRKKITQVKKKILKKHMSSAKKVPSKPKIIGRVVHYYGKPGVAIVEVATAIALGEVVRIRHGEHEMAQAVTSLQIDHQPVIKAKKGDIIGMKVSMKAPEGSLVLPA